MKSFPASLSTLLLIWIGSTATECSILPGQLTVDPSSPSWLMRKGGNHVFICGPGDPEDFLYRGTELPDGTRDGDQFALIRKLLENGGNCLYIQAVRSHGGDGGPDHNPFFDHDPKNGVNPAVLSQWEEWFTLLDNHGVLIYFFLYDDSARVWNTGDVVGEPEKRFVQTMVKRFKHHRNWIWVVAEESEEALTSNRAGAIARIIRDTDEHQHLIGNHHQSGINYKSFQSDGVFDHFAMQLNVPESEVFIQTLNALELARGKYQLIYSENTETVQSVDGWRRHAWQVAMAGAMPMLLGMDIATTPTEALKQCRILSDFFEDTTYHKMTPKPSMVDGSTRHVLAGPDHSFIAWSDTSGSTGLNLKDVVPGFYELLWLDCRNGRRVEAEKRVVEDFSVFPKPKSIGPECALYARRVQNQNRGQIEFPDLEWKFRMPADVGLRKEKLVEFSQIAGGRGCMIRDGFLVFSWGDMAKPGDIASASKPIYSHLLFRALEAGKLESADDEVASFQPCLNDLNPGLDFKDRNLTFRHLAFQTACLGYGEFPGNAYDYNDHTMGLFWDVLVNQVFETDWREAGGTLFQAELSGPLQFQDGFNFPVEGRMRGRPAISPRDFARFGWLYLNQGRWKDRQLLGVRHALLAATDPLSLNIPRTNGAETDRCGTRTIGGGGNQTDHNGGYSWLWWLNTISRDGKRWWSEAPKDLFCALGHCGRRGLAILPTQRMVVSWNDAGELHCDRELGNRAFRTLLDAVE